MPFEIPLRLRASCCYENAISGEANSPGAAAMPANSLLLLAIGERLTLLRIGADKTRWALFMSCCLAQKTRDLNFPAAMPNSSQASSFDISLKYAIVNASRSMGLIFDNR